MARGAGQSYGRTERMAGEVSAHAMPSGWVGLWDRIRTDDEEAGSWVAGSMVYKVGDRVDEAKGKWLDENV